MVSQQSLKTTKFISGLVWGKLYFTQKQTTYVYVYIYIYIQREREIDR